ncbi:MAG: CYTH domain-containing protein [Candidatus Nanoarchaeia archaeon]|jgi:predicted adenylyl cyclase CyaB
MEIEIRAFIENAKAFEKRLKEMGIKQESESHIIDYWFCRKEVNSFEGAKMDKVGSYGFRIRTEVKKGKLISQLNCKVLAKQFDHNAFIEHESDIINPAECRKILECVGFKNFCIVDKKRITYRIKRCLVNIELIKGFKPAVEFEIISDKNISHHKMTIMELMKKLKIKQENLIKKSITFLYMETHSKF